jgi:hypothetical protein
VPELDLSKLKIKETITVRKFDGDWTEDQIANGEAEDALTEVLTLEDGVVINQWRKSDADQED